MANKIKIAGTTSNTFSVGLNGDGNITAAYYIGNGSQLTGVTATTTPAGANTQIQFNDGGATGASANLTFNKTTNTLSVTNIIANGAGLTNIAGANVTGTVANANLSQYSNIISDASNATSQQILFATSGGGISQLKFDPSFTYNSSINALSVGNLINFGSNITGPRFISNVATGASPFIVTSTTRVANLNVATAGVADSATVAASANAVAGANVSGTVANSTAANLIQTVTSIASTSYLLFTNTAANGFITPVKNTSITANLANASLIATTFVGELSGLATSATVAASANSVDGANVSGAVAFATTANSVAVGNVSGIGNIATLNLDGNAGNILYGNGIFASTPIVTSVANANYSNFAGTAYSVDAANISGTVNLANYATTANSVAIANVVGIGNIATTNYNGNGSQVLAGNGAWVVQSGGGGSTATDFTPSFLLGGM